MAASADGFVVGDIIEIKYRVPQFAVDDRPPVTASERWVMAEIIHQDEDSLPMARLADGQVTDIRAYMTWRLVARAAERRFG
ncbi:MAG: hypothetical protein QM780_12750 [Hyphomicrobium sp.]|uniref:hypothetical protein n=1 Tax=Hyphomicrobium sp. TaxID=82 RepID=UPI0039E5B032